MKGIVDYRSFRRAYDRCKIVEIGFAHTLEAFEMRQQSLTCLLAYALYRIESRHCLRTAATVAVMGYAKAVGLVAQMLHDPERFRIFVDIKRHAVAWK